MKTEVLFNSCKEFAFHSTDSESFKGGKTSVQIVLKVHHILARLSHNSVEQKLVVLTPSCATNVSEYSSVVLLCGALMTWKVFCFVLTDVFELFLGLCTVAPNSRTFDSTGLVSLSDIPCFVSFWLDSSILDV